MTHAAAVEEILLEFLEENRSRDPVDTAKLFGIDLGLLNHNISLSQSERIRQLQEWMRFQSNLQWSKSKNS